MNKAQSDNRQHPSSSPIHPPNGPKRPSLLFIKQDSIVKALQFDINHPHQHPSVLDPLPSSRLYEVETDDGHSIVNHGDFIIEDANKCIQVIPYSKFTRQFISLEILHELDTFFSDKHYPILHNKLKSIIQELSCTCGNSNFGFNCVCDWVNTHPGTTNYSCEFCGIYTASAPQCNKCEESEQNATQ